MSACKLISLQDCDKVESRGVDAGHVLLNLTTVKQSTDIGRHNHYVIGYLFGVLFERSGIGTRDS